MPRALQMSPRIILGVAGAYSVFAALVSYWFTRATGLSLWTLQPDASTNFTYILAINVVIWTGWALFAPLVFELARRFRFDRKGWRRALLVHVPMSVLVTSAHITLGATGRVALQKLWGVDATWQGAVYDAFFRTLDFELPVYWALVGLQHAIDYYREVRARETKTAQLETRLVEAQLQALQRQLHPHFLFNTLHAISALVHRDPDKADEMIERLSDLLRLTLDKVGIQEVTLGEELEYLRAYLDIEQVHFGDRLEVFYRIDGQTLDALVPNLILQPVAENAIRHGLAPCAGKGQLSIEVIRRADRLVLRVVDNGRGMSATSLSAANHGVGLTNTRARLERLYRDAATLDFAPRQGGGLIVTITLPFSNSARDPGKPAASPAPDFAPPSAGGRRQRGLAEAAFGSSGERG
jgi:two-component system, LytTR family, sensor kinase